MSGERFTIDTNLLVYAADGREPEKQALAQVILRRAVLRNCCLTIQVVMEFYAAARRKLRLPPAAAAAHARRYATLFQTAAPSRGAMLRALTAAESGHFEHWDALMLATAEEAGCAIALSEDMRDGARLGNIAVCHPFSGADLSDGAKQLLGL